MKFSDLFKKPSLDFIHPVSNIDLEPLLLRPVTEVRGVA